MDLESSAREYSAALTSARANERKKSAEALKDLLTRNALPSLLSKNTLKKRGFSWNDLFVDINDCILKETEKYETSKSFNTVTGPLCTNLLHRCIAGANKGQAYIKCDKIMDACLFILKDSRLTKAIGDAYLNLLHKHVLSCDHYLGHITPSHWNDLLDVCITVCLSKASKLDNYTKLRLLLLTIKSGTKYCQLVTPLKDSISNLQKCVLQIHNDKKVQEVVIEIVIILLEMLSTESRLLMCQFSESILSVILKFYDHSLEHKKKASLFKLLELIVMLHHPEGKLPKEDGSLADNWETWQRHMNNILEIITLEISFLQKVRKQNECSESNNSHFSSLAAALYYQVFHTTVDCSSSCCSNDNEAGTSSKRQKTASNKYKSFADLIYQLQLNYVPWLAILHMYVKDYGVTISDIDYLSMIKIIEVILNGSNHHFDWEIFEEFTCMIIQNLKANILSNNYNNATDDFYDNFLTLWNSCVRNSTSVNLANKALHAIMQLLLETKFLKYQNVHPLIKLYLERGMPVNDSSVKTINKILNKFFNQCSSLEQRKNVLCWFVDGDVASVGEASKELLLRLISNDNTNIIESPDLPDPDRLFDVIFFSIDKSILFSEFELEMITYEPNEPLNVQVPKQSELNIEMNSLLQSSLENKLSLDTEQFKSKSMNPLRFSQFINIAISYLDLMIKYKFLSTDEIRQLQLYASLKSSLKILFVSLVSTLKSNELIANKIKLLQYMRVLLTNEYVPFLSLEIRRSIEEEFFHYANNILTSEQEMEDDVVYEGDENEMNATTMKYNCIYTLAAYCRTRANYREELLELILDPKLYNFDSVWDVKCALRCIEILSQPGAEEPPLDLIFIFMQYICKVLFRVPDATFGLLNVLMKILELLWAHDDNMKQNSFIMIRGYLERCDKLFYPPHVAALIFKCAAKMVVLNAAQITDVDDIFIRSIIKKSRSDIHCIRIYCCYLLEKLSHHPDFNITGYLSDISEIFTNVPHRQQIILKDESTNRSLTVLHSLIVLANTKKSLIREIVTLILSLQKEKSLNIKLVKKTLNFITMEVDGKIIDLYFRRNVLSILQFWFTKKFDLSSLPIECFYIRNEDELFDKYMKWLISADVLWRHGGNIHASEVLKRAKSRLAVSESKIIELCFCNIIVLCLPYIVTEKYGLRHTPAQNEHQFKQSMINATRMFQMTRQILDNEKWSNLFVENVGELLLLTATHLSDHVEARDQFQVDVLEKPEAYQYPTLVFKSILKYFGELTDGNIMLYLCENQPVAIFKILLKLWENVVHEVILELKVLRVHAFKTFVEYIPLVSPSDAFVCNYVCHCFGYAIKHSQNDKEVKILALGLKSTLQHFLPGEVNILRKALSQLMSTLIIKKEEGFEKECDDLLNYLVVDMKDYLKEQEDVVDFIRSMSSQHGVENLSCSTFADFSEKLKTYKVALNSPSYESLSNLHQFLKINNKHVNGLSKYLETVRFSEDSGTSLIHQIIYKLNNIMKSVNDNKTVIEACNCLSEIGTYDLKTLVTLPPKDTKAIVAAQPRQSFAVAAVASLSEVLFDEITLVTEKVAKTLNILLKYKEGEEAVDSGEVDKQILKPFTSPDQGNEVATFQINNIILNRLPIKEFMIPDGNIYHHEWLVKNTVAILDVLDTESNYLNSLGEVCQLKFEVCQKVLPALIGLLLDFSSHAQINIMSSQINNFFEYIWAISFDDNFENSADSSNYKRTDVINQNHKMIIQDMLEVVNFVRLQRKHYNSRGDRVETLNYLKLDYDRVAWAATVAEQNLLAIYYAELWTVAMNDGVPPSSPDATTALEGGKDLQRILRKSFVSIGELDAVDGCGTAHLTIEDEKRKHLTNTGQYLDALLMHDIALSCARADPDLRRGVVRSLHKSGMHHLALQYIKSLPENDQLSDIKYECLSFLGDWSDFVDTRDLEEKCAVPNSNTQSVLKAFRYVCLKDCLNIQIKPEFQDRVVQHLNSAKLAVSKMCKHLNIENCQSIYKVLSKLHLFTDIEDYFAVRCNKLPLYDLLEKWRVENLPAFQDFKHLEDLISQRNIILEHSAKSYSTSLKDIVTLQLQYAELSLNNQRIQMAQRLLAVVKKMQTSKEVALLESQISWAKGHKDIALSLLSNIVSSPDSERSSDAQKTAVSLRQYGLWMAESKSDNARNIINKYLKKSLELTKGDDMKTRQKVYFDIAKFADAEYKQVVTYMNSAIFENKVKCLESMKDTASSLKQTQTLSKEERKALLTNERFEKLEEADITSTKAEKETFLQLAMRYYLLSLKECDENNLSVFRVISLWLDNPSLQLDADSESFEKLLHGIPSRKFVAVLPQLAPRLSDEESAFADNLKRIIKRCALEHPHHTLPILFSLKNSDKDKCILNASQAAGRAQRNAPQEPRVVAAEVLVRQVASESAVLAVVVAQMEQLCDAIISFANFKPKAKTQQQKIPPAEKIHKLSHLDSIPIPTDTVPIRSDCDYGNLSTLVSFDGYFELVGGINCPKKVNCRGSDGCKKILLIKGEDDLRQDAVMQQVFNIVNTLLENNAITNRNKLLIRTYKVVPMSRQSGVLEWCVGTMPIGAYLVGSADNRGAHARYRPQDISCSAARQLLNKCHEQRKSNKAKLEVFLNILKQFKPVFHYFFTEHYLDAVTWYERRLAYTKSVATSSMVGYILGLGDRHVQNILIDEKTAEVIHIDFGIAFDQGRALPTPETIPFRLTQDMIAGFGCSGVEGIFRRCCEKTMQLLRDNQETLLTILEVLLCDPLYSWTVANAAQPTAPTPANKDTTCTTASNSGLAERALLAVSSKLSGIEGGVAGGVAVPGQVARLITDAADPANLSRVFPGWQPYL